MSILDRLKALVQRSPGDPPAAVPMPPEDEDNVFDRLERFIDMLENTHEEELSCEDVHWLMAQYAEALEQGHDPGKLMPLVRQHLELCHECEEELEAVLAILQASDSL